jgi:hypothetical protein
MSDAKKMKSELDSMQYLYNAAASAWMPAPVPPTPEQIAADPRVRALVEAARKVNREYVSYRFNTLGDYYEPGSEPEVKALEAALAALAAQGGET